MKKKKSNIVNFIICGLTLVLVFVYLFAFHEGEALKDALLRFRIEYLLLALTLMVLYWVLEAVTIQLLIRKVWPHMPFRRTMITTMIGQYFNCITPLSSGGQPVQAYYMARYGMPPSASMTILLARLIVYEFTLTAYSIVVLVLKLPYFLEGKLALVIMALIGFALNAIGLVLFFLLGFWHTGTTKLAHFGIRLLARLHIVKDRAKTVSRVDKQMEGAYRNMHFVLKLPGTVLLIILITVVQLTLFYGISYVIYLGFYPEFLTNGQGTDFFTVLSCQSLVAMVSAMIPLPGAAGASETAYAMYFNGVYPQTAEGQAAVGLSMILWRFLTFYLAIIIGIIITLILNQGKGTPREALAQDEILDELEEEGEKALTDGNTSEQVTKGTPAAGQGSESNNPPANEN